jgi:hypothetical protein
VETKNTASMPENYYYSQKPAVFDSPRELIRFASIARPYTTGFSISERVAFFQWYLKNRGFNVSFVSSNNFENMGKEHVWLVVNNNVGEVMAVEPSFVEMRAESISPTTLQYKNYQKQFKDIYELSKNTGGLDRYAWWKKPKGQDFLDHDFLLMKKSKLSS